MIALRPLSFGEIFDRAITIGLRNAWSVTLLAGIPLFVSSAIYTVAVTGVATYGSLWAIATHDRTASTVFFGPSPAVRFAVLACMTVISCFVTSMIVKASARTMDGGGFDAKAALASACSHWRSIAQIAAIAIAIHLPLSLSISRHWRIAEWVLIPLDIWLSLLLSIAICAVVIESSPTGAALRSAASRVSGSEFGRSVGIIAALYAFAFIGAIVQNGLGALAFAVGVRWATLPLVAVLDALVGCLLVLVFVVYYFDIRVRREGLGLL